MKKLVLALAATFSLFTGVTAHADYVAPHIQHAPYGEINIVIPVTTNDPAVFGMKLRNIDNALKSGAEWGAKEKVKVVLYAAGVKNLISPTDAVKSKLDELRKAGVQVEICNNSLREQGLDFHTLYGVTDADVVPSGFLEVAYLQTQGYNVDPVN